MNKKALLIFTRNPELGKCKTRLAKTVGDKNALEIYKLLLKHTANITKEIDCDKHLFYSVKIRNNDIWDAAIYSKHQQYGANLGERMKNAFQQTLNNGYEKVIIIGSDLYDLKPEHLNKAFKELDKNDVVIGPALDGGYYLLGMKKLQKNIFNNKAWGTATVRQDTLNDLSNQKVALLEPLNDIDVFDDIKDYDVFKKYL